MLEKLFSIPRTFFSRDGKRLSLVAYAFLALLCVGFFTPGIATMPPTDRDESSFAQASKQMIETGNYTDIRLQQEPRYKKPIGIYWLQSSAVRLLNPRHLNEIWAYRVPSFIGALVAVLMTAALGSLLFDPATGLLAAIMMAGCVILNVEARLAKTDAALLGCVVTAMYGLARAFVYRGIPSPLRGGLEPAPYLIRGRGGCRESPSLEITNGSATVQITTPTDDSQSSPPLPTPPLKGEGIPPCLRRVGFLTPLLFWTALAVGILIKGPIILLPVCGVLLWLKVSDKNIAWFRALRPSLGIPYALLLIAPWFIAISLQSHGAFMQQSAGHDLLAKLWQGQNKTMRLPGTHALWMPVVFFPFSLFVVLAIPDVWKNRSEAAVKFCLGWIVPAWIVFELALTKLPHYVLPAYPAIALLAAHFLVKGLPTVSETKRRFSLILIYGFWLLLGFCLAAALDLLPVFSDRARFVPQILAGAVLIATQIAALAFLRKNKIASLIILTLGALIFLPVTFGSTLPRLRHVWLSREIVEAAEAIKPCAKSQIVTAGYREPSLAFLAGTDTLMTTNGEDAAADLKQDSCRVAAIDAKHKQEFLDSFANAAEKPTEVGVITGLNSGHGAGAALTLYILAGRK
ncbi:MAG: glycosyltransferase family 39 protein [Alphaproteobacteria bacterium]|nr:glycosyltransferase family 39 protein [Alphaproteobacteria bacterium]